jgi:hypothetical protein
LDDRVRAGYIPLTNYITILEKHPLELEPNEGITTTVTIRNSQPFLVSQRNLIGNGRARKVDFIEITEPPYEYDVSVTNTTDQSVECKPGSALCQLKLYHQQQPAITSLSYQKFTSTYLKN